MVTASLRRRSVPIRVAHVVTRNQHRGAENVAVLLAEQLSERGLDNRVVSLGEVADGSRNAAIRPVQGRVSPSMLTLPVIVPRLRAALRGADLVVGHGGLATIAAVGSVGAAVPVVYQRILLMPSGYVATPRSIPLRLALRRVAAAVAITPQAAMELRQLGFRGPVVSIPNVRELGPHRDVDRAGARTRLLERLSAEDHPDLLVVGFVGHLVPQKQPSLAVEVLTRTVASGVRAHLVMAGDGPLREEVTQLIDRRSLSDHVSMLGHVDDVRGIVAGVDVLLICSRAESMPGVAIEAHMAGTPVVAFDLDGLPTVVEHGSSGVIVPHGDVDALARALRSLARDRRILDTMSATAAERGSDFAVEKQARVYAELLRSLVA